ncbi:hypothetical protein ACFYLX_18750 [Pseudarthrobacter enclensis]|uniref:hypothetical protein n=1 Tax=Pseudarthrobacter enclensis TaxID=993070 RepID=UPI0036820770
MDAEFNLFTDYHQFTVSDPTADFSDLWEKWTDATIESMFVQGDRYIAVGTARDFHAPVLIRLGSERSFTGRVSDDGIEGEDRYMVTLTKTLNGHFLETGKQERSS